jgi:hypothetical protein
MRKLFLSVFTFASLISIQAQAAVTHSCSQTILTSFIRSEVSINVINEPYVAGATDILAEIFMDGDWYVGGVYKGNVQDDTTNSVTITVTGTAPNQIMNGSVAAAISTTRWGNYPTNSLPLTWDVLKADGLFYGKISGTFVHYPSYDETCQGVFSTE